MDTSEPRDWLSTNRANWDERVPLHVAGGFLYLAEFHPITDSLDDETGSRVVHDYFARDAKVYESAGTYADLEARTENNTTVGWQHTIGDVVSALAAQGPRLEFLHEHDVSLFPRLGSFQRDDKGHHRFPEGSPSIPLMYSLRASKPRR